KTQSNFENRWPAAATGSAAEICIATPSVRSSAARRRSGSRRIRGCPGRRSCALRLIALTGGDHLLVVGSIACLLLATPLCAALGADLRHVVADGLGNFGHL